MLTHRFWKDVLNSDPAVLDQSISLGSIAATVVGVLEPSVSYPTETQIIANMVTSPHHLGATMNTDRRHRITDLFGRLAPGATLEAARAELTSVHASMLRAHPDAYSSQAWIQLQVRTLQEQIAAERLNAFVFSALGGIALLIAIVGVAGVLTFSVSARTREFGVRLAVGSTPRDLRAGVLRDGMGIAAIGIAAGATGGYVLVRVAKTLFGSMQLPGALPVVGAAVVLIGAAMAASFMPATRASRVDVLQALRSE